MQLPTPDLCSRRRTGRARRARRQRGHLCQTAGDFNAKMTLTRATRTCSRPWSSTFSRRRFRRRCPYPELPPNLDATAATRAAAEPGTPPRAAAQPSPVTTFKCREDCVVNNVILSSDGVCDDGGSTTGLGLCNYGSDCQDCGPRPLDPDEGGCWRLPTQQGDHLVSEPWFLSSAGVSTELLRSVRRTQSFAACLELCYNLGVAGDADSQCDYAIYGRGGAGTDERLCTLPPAYPAGDGAWCWMFSDGIDLASDETGLLVDRGTRL